MNKFSQLPADVFKHVQMNAGVMLSEFDPTVGTVDRDKIIGATSGGNTFEAKPNFTDFGDDIDNCPKNTKQLKKIDSVEVTMSGDMVAADTNAIKMLMGSAYATDMGQEEDAPATAQGLTKITPTMELTDADFKDIWMVGDYSDVNTGADAGFLAIRLKDALSTGGFKLKTDDKKKGTFSYEFTAHTDLVNPEELPYEIYVKQGVDDIPGETSGDPGTDGDSETGEDDPNA
jgi:hypothetical protein